MHRCVCSAQNSVHICHEICRKHSELSATVNFHSTSNNSEKSKDFKMVINRPIREFMSGKTIFVTGGTGFMGKVLLEKLLRDCGDLNCIYVLLRSKDDHQLQEKLTKLRSNRVFDVIRERNADSMNKLVAINGDMTVKGLGLRPIDKQTLLDSVNIVFHCAASVRFDESLHTATILNTRGTQEIIDLAKRMQHLLAFVHVSTAYSNSNHKHIHEFVYNSDLLPTGAYDYKTVINACEQNDTTLLQYIQSAIIPTVFPNTYIYSKHLAENVAYDARHDIPICILRPSVVAPASREPYPGWVDSLNGPIGIFVAGASGVLRIIYVSSENTPDLVPVDFACNSFIAAASHIGQQTERKLNGHTDKLLMEIDDVTMDDDNAKIIEESEQIAEICPVFNCTVSAQAAVSWKDLIAVGLNAYKETPLEKIIWYPSGSMTNNYILYVFNVMLFQYLPALLVDAVLIIFRQKPFLLKIQNKIFSSMKVLSVFIHNQWYWDNRQLRLLYKNMSPADQHIFDFDAFKIDYRTFMANWILGARRFLLKLDDSTIPASKQLLMRLYWASLLVRTILITLVMWIIYAVLNRLLNTFTGDFVTAATLDADTFINVK